MVDVRYFEELDTNTSIDWWNENRAKINDVIRRTNQYQIQNSQTINEKKMLLSQIDVLIDRKGNPFSDWQIELLEEIKTHLNSL